MTDQDPVGSGPPDQQRQQEARNDLYNFLEKLKKVCSSFETANDWVNFVGELGNLLQTYQNEIPADRSSALTQAMALTDPSREGLTQACKVLELELEKTIRSLPSGGRSCGCLGGGLAAIVIGLAVVVGLLVAVGVFLIRPVDVNVVNGGCGTMFVRQGVPPQFLPVINFLGVELPDVIDSPGEGRFQVPGLPLRVAVNGTARDPVSVSVLGIGVPFEVSDNVTYIEVNGQPVLGNTLSVGVRDTSTHNIFISCE